MENERTDGAVTITEHGVSVFPYRPNQSRFLEKQNSIFDKVYHRRKEITGFCVPFKGHMGYLTQSYQPQYLQDLFPSYRIYRQKQMIPYRLSNPVHALDSITPTDVQQSLISQITTDISSKRINSWFLQLQTGYGKTVISVILSTLIGYRTFIIADSKDIKEQWINTYYTKTDIEDGKVLEMRGSAILDKILKDPEKYNNYDVFITTPSLMTSFGKSRGYDQLTQLFKVLGIGFLVIDEAHRNIGNTVRMLATVTPAYILFLSADFGQADSKKEQMFFQIFKNVRHIVPDKEFQVSMKYTEAVVMEYNSRPTEIERGSVFDKFGYSASMYVSYQLKKGVMMECIEYIMDAFCARSNDGFKTAILAPKVSHVEEIYERLHGLYGDKRLVVRFHGQMTDEERAYAKTYGEIIVSTYKGFSTGIDVTDIKYVIATNQSNKIEDNQAAGRARPLRDGSKALYFMLIDEGFSYCKKKLRTRVAYLKETKLSGLHKLKFYSNQRSVLSDLEKEDGI